MEVDLPFSFPKMNQIRELCALPDHRDRRASRQQMDGSSGRKPYLQEPFEFSLLNKPATRKVNGESLAETLGGSGMRLYWCKHGQLEKKTFLFTGQSHSSLAAL